MLSRKLRVQISKEFAQEVEGKIFHWELPAVPETKGYPNTFINQLTLNSSEVNLTEKDIIKVKEFHGGHYKHLIPPKPEIKSESDKILYNAWTAVVKNKTYSAEKKSETLNLIQSTLNGKAPQPLKKAGVIAGQGLKKFLKNKVKTS
eukprot:NODE_84_length_22354_cov_0.646506.p16 type:complete len:147 gc:universal NODE_84_length_22354_cov_0.646506:10234-10674(+)